MLAGQNHNIERYSSRQCQPSGIGCAPAVLTAVGKQHQPLLRVGRQQRHAELDGFLNIRAGGDGHRVDAPKRGQACRCAFNQRARAKRNHRRTVAGRQVGQRPVDILNRAFALRWGD